MSITTPVYNQLLSLLNEHSQYRDLRHLKALAWMINALICSGTIYPTTTLFLKGLDRGLILTAIML